MFRLSRRDALLVFLGACCMQLLSFFFNPSYVPLLPPTVTTTTTLLLNNSPIPQNPPAPPPSPTPPKESPSCPQESLSPSPPDLSLSPSLPETAIIAHAPGWTIYSNLYMAEGTLFIVSSQPKSSLPPIRMMISTPLEASATEENIRLREPTDAQMMILTPEEAMSRWGGDVPSGERNRVWTIDGNTFLINDPGQFLGHYYHFVAELFLGIWAFWTGSFPPHQRPTSNSQAVFHPAAPPIDRLFFAQAAPHAWRDGPGFNSYFLRAVFPSLAVEHESEWEDRVQATLPPPSSQDLFDPETNEKNTRLSTRVWHFPLVLLADRSAAFRGDSCGSRTQRTASEAWDVTYGPGGKKEGQTKWWEPIRRAVARFAGVAEEDLGVRNDEPRKIVVTYISRQGSRRRLIRSDHEVLVSALEELNRTKNEAWKDGVQGAKEWELNVVRAETLTKDEQVRIMARTNILLGVHGNGLTHLVLIPHTRISTVIEIFYPGGFAHDYEWTTRALGMKHFAFWNDTHHTYPNEPRVDYPDGFQGENIPVYGPAVAKLIEDRVEGRL